jgi:hypothetical protein
MSRLHRRLERTLLLSFVVARGTSRRTRTMTTIACIRFDDGALIMPARSGYDRELVFEEAQFYARRHGTVRLELGARTMVIRSIEIGARQRCASCEKNIAATSFSIDSRPLCRRCIRELERLVD